MSTEAFVWVYERGMPSTFEFCDVRQSFGEAVKAWDADRAVLRVEFIDPANYCDIHCCKYSVDTDTVRSLSIADPIRHVALWDCVFRLMAGRNAALFFSYDTTPLFWNLDSVGHFPNDLIAELGKPKRVRTPQDILDHISGTFIAE